MSIVVKDVDKEVYARFKARAALFGLKIGEAITLAMGDWLNHEIDPISIEGKHNQNVIFYRQIIGDLLKNSLNKWSVISNGDLVGIFDTEIDALQSVRQLEGPNLIFQIAKPKIKIRHLGMGSIKIRRKWN